jgi:hypothetical protein
MDQKIAQFPVRSTEKEFLNTVKKGKRHRFMQCQTGFRGLAGHRAAFEIRRQQG